MTTIIPHLTITSVLAARHFADVRPLATAHPALPAARSWGLVLLILMVVLLGTVGRAARGVADLMAGFLQIAASLTAALFTLLIVVLIILVVLARH